MVGSRTSTKASRHADIEEAKRQAIHTHSFSNHFVKSCLFSKHISSSAGCKVKCSVALASKVFPLSLPSVGGNLISKFMTNRANVVRMLISARGRPMQP